MKVDWEQRTWELFKCSAEINNKEDALIFAKEYVEYYKSQMEKPTEKKESSVKTLEERQAKFLSECRERIELYGKQMVQEFYNYWSEPSKSKKMRWELQKTWDIDRRMATWAKWSGIAPKEKKKVDTDYERFCREK